MKYILISAALLVQPLGAATGTPDLPLEGYVSSWEQACAGSSCALPVPGERNRRVSMRLSLPSAPGEAGSVRRSETLALPGGEALEAELAFYAVCPYGGASGCAGRYFQAQVSLSGPAGAACTAALNAADFAPFPVLTCAGAAPGGRRYGLTLHRAPL